MSDLPEPWVFQMTAFAPLNPLPRCQICKILIVPCCLLSASVEDHEIVNQGKEPFFLAERDKIITQTIIGFSGLHLADLDREYVRCLFVLFPLQIELFLCPNHAVAQALNLVAGHEKLLRAEEARYVLLLLVCQHLPDALANGHAGSFQLYHAQRNAVYVKNNIRPLPRATVSSED